MTVDPYNALVELGKVRAAVKQFEEAAKAAEAPYLAAAAAASAKSRAALESLKPLLEQREEAARASYAVANTNRTERLLAGEEAPAVPVPPGCEVQIRQSAEITCSEAIPREYCEPKKSLVVEALKLGDVPGAVLRPKFVFVFRSRK